MGPDLDVGLAPAGEGGGFAHAALLEVEQGDDEPVLRLEAVEEEPHRFPGLAAGAGAFVPGILVFATLGRIDEGLTLAAAAVRAEEIVAAPHRHGHDPVFEGRVAAVSREPAPEFDEEVLDEILEFRRERANREAVAQMRGRYDAARWTKASSSPRAARATHSDSGISVSTVGVARVVAKKNMVSKRLPGRRTDRIHFRLHAEDGFSSDCALALCRFPWLTRPIMKRIPLILSLVAAILSGANLRAHESAVDMADAAKVLLASLSEDQKAKVVRPLTDKERELWHFVPHPFEGEGMRIGLALKDMRPDQRHLAYALLSTGLSHRGYTTALEIMSLEQVLWELENQAPKRDTEMYYVSVFGEPGSKAWGWRFEGHHLSLNFTVADGKVVAETPNFFASNPGEVRQGPRAGLRVLAGEEDVARALVTSLDDGQKAKAILGTTAPDDILTSNQPTASPLEGGGIAYADLTAEQKTGLKNSSMSMSTGSVPTWPPTRSPRSRKPVSTRWSSPGSAGSRRTSPLLPGAGSDFPPRVREHPERGQSRARRLARLQRGFRP